MSLEALRLGRNADRVLARSTGRSRESGAILIVALGVLTLLAVLGATFAQLMSLEKQAAENYVDDQHMDLLTNSAIDMVIAQLHDYSNRQSWSAYTSLPWKYFLKDENDLAHGRVGIEDNRVGDWITYSEAGGKRFRFKTKVIDCSAQINLNGKQDTLARMLDNLGEAIERSERLKREPGRVVTNPFYTEKNHGGKRVRGTDILLFRQRLEGRRFQSKSQLRQLIGEENYDLVKDFLTCWSWEDPYTYGPSDGINEVPDLATGVTTVAASSVPGSAGLAHAPASDSPRIVHEPRHPVNLNTAPEEVLIACLQGLAGRRVFPYSQLGVAGGGLEAIDSQAQILGQRLLFGQEEIRNVLPRSIFVYSREIDYQQAKRLAQRIIAQRKDPATTFRTWRTNDPAWPGFEDFVDRLEDDFFPSPDSARILDPALPLDRSIEGRVKSGGTNPVGRLWIKGNVQGIARQVYAQKNLPVHERNAWYYEMVKGILKANFNPNTRINRYNPNAPAWVPVDKSDLVWLDPAGGGAILKKGHTTEFCFDSMGRYEVTTLGEMVDLTKVRSNRTVVGQAGDSNLVGPDTFAFKRKMRTIVQVFDVLRHTNQMHFEKTFQTSGRSSRNDRKYVVTWPEPMAALTELYSAGSPRDGRIELAGQLDGQRLQLPLLNRQQAAGNNSDVLLEHSFMMRDAQSIARLRQVMRRGGGGVNALVGDEVQDALRDVFDADDSKYRNTYREYYRQRDMSALGVFAGNEAVWYDPLVGRESVATDLFPDGLHTSILRMSHLGSRLLVLPARQKIGEIGSGGGNVRYGASGRGTRGQNVYGNVPYYNGGLAFWVKFDFNGDDPVFSGLIGCTQVITEVLPASQNYTGSEGTQFFIFKNSVGQLRVVRMYYHQAFPEFGGTGDGGGDAGIVLFPDAGGSGANASDPNNPIIDELDPQKWISRSDILLDISHIRAHEWHHVAVEWNDQNTVRPIRLYLDFEEVDEATPRMAQQIVDGTANSWVRLNERQPRDGLSIGGIVRNQGVDDAGIFKWYTNTAQAPGGRGIQPVAQSIKRILANATIDDLITFQGTFATAKTYYGGRGQPGYFTNQTGEYANVFEVPLPPEIDQVVLRSFDWTSYYPATYTDSQTNSPPQSLNTNSTPIMAEVTFNGPSLPRQSREPWREPTVDNFVSGKTAVRQRTGIRGESVDIVYKFRMSGARSTGGRTIGGVVQTPVIDDVTLTYFLPSPKILLQEEDN